MIARIILALLLLTGVAAAQPSGPTGGGYSTGSAGLTLQNPTSVTSYTLQSSDCNTAIPFTASTTVIVTLPATLPLGCEVGELQDGTGTVVNYGGAGALLNSLYNATYSLNTALFLQVSSQPTSLTNTWTVLNVGRYYSPSGTVMPTLPPAVFTPTATYYVSPTGSDSAAGTSPATAWQTITKVNNFATFAPGTAILFQGGQSWTGCLALIGGGNVSGSTTSTLGIILSTYGTGNATFTSNCPGTGSGNQGPKSAVVKFDNINGIYASNIVAQCNNTGTQYGILVQNSQNSNALSGVTLTSDSASGCNISTSATEDVSADIAILPKNTVGSCVQINNVLINGVTASGTSLTGTDDVGILLNGCAASTGVTNATVINSTVTDIGGRASGVYGGGSGNGILCNGCLYANFAYNTVSYGGANVTTCGGPGGIWSYDTGSIWINHNEVNHMGWSGAQPSGACDQLAYDLDGCTYNSVISYNHSDNNAGNAWEFYQDSYPASGYCPAVVWGPNYIHHNISENDMTSNISTNSHANGQSLGVLSAAGGTGNTPGTEYYFNNTAVNNITTEIGTCIGFYAPPNAGVFDDNLCQMNGTTSYVALDGSGNAFPPTMIMDYNSYYYTNNAGNFQVYSMPGGNNWYTLSGWCSGTGFDCHSIQTAPGFSGTPAYAACTVTSNSGPQPCPTALTLSSNANARGTGVALSANAYASWYNTVATDYYGAGVPSTYGSGWNMGASGN